MKKKILILEDCKDIGEILESCLEFEFEVVLVENGKEGLLKLEKERFDLVITDYNMPFMNGLEFAIKAKNNYPELPIIMISAHAFLSELSLGFNLITKSLEKPVSLLELEDAIENILRKI